MFERLQSEGAITPEVRFQVSIPTPMAAAYHYIAPDSRAAFVEVYQQSLLAEVDEILGQLPHERLAIQWDVCQEILVFEDYYPGRPADYKSQIFHQLGNLGDAVPPQGPSRLSPVLWLAQRRTPGA